MKRKKTIIYCDNRMQAYIALRFRSVCKFTALEAWKCSADFGKVSRWFGACGIGGPDANPVRGGQPHKAGGEMMTWCEDTSYFRNVRTSGEVIDLNHTGWYTDDEFQDEVICGMVFQLPGKDHQPRFLIGRSDPNNDGTACIDMETIYDDEKEAARIADRVAEIVAEDERDYQRAWRAGNDAGEAHAKAGKCRKRIVKLIAEMKAAKGEATPRPTICSELRGRVRGLKRLMAALKRKVVKLTDEFGREDGFKNAWSDHLPKPRVKS